MAACSTSIATSSDDDVMLQAGAAAHPECRASLETAASPATCGCAPTTSSMSFSCRDGGSWLYHTTSAERTGVRSWRRQRMSCLQITAGGGERRHGPARAVLRQRLLGTGTAVASHQRLHLSCSGQRQRRHQHRQLVRQRRRPRECFSPRNVVTQTPTHRNEWVSRISRVENAVSRAPSCFAESHSARSAGCAANVRQKQPKSFFDSAVSVEATFRYSCSSPP